jgi:hypothetical protein
MIEPTGLSAASDPERLRLQQAGAAFEALILGQMLQGLMPEANATSGAATQALARQLAQDSPFGIARLLGAQTQ